ncbi:MAG: anti-sigma factor family protein [Caulobacteraceae bacterium]
MDCDKYKEDLHGYVSGSLNELEHRAVIKHLKSCEKCREEVLEIRELRKLLKCSSESIITPPMDLKASIMSSINLRKYKKVYKSTLGELTNWGMSLVAAGFIMLFINLAPIDNITKVGNELNTTTTNISERLHQPLSSFGKSFDNVTEKFMELDGITGRLEREKKGGK